MITRTMKSTELAERGFSLIEVALALGVAAFALVAILGLIPIGLNSNKASIEQTEAAIIAAGVVVDLRAATVSVPPAAANSPRFQIPLPVSGAAMHTIFLREDGSAAGVVDADAVSDQDPRYRVTLFITAPSAPTQKTATIVRVLVTAPAMADPVAGTPPAKYSNSYEVATALNRN